MDQLTNHYRYKCQVLAEQVRQLESKIKMINEDANLAGVFGQSAPTENQDAQLYALLQDLLKPENWNNPGYWQGYSSPGEFLGAILGKITSPPAGAGVSSPRPRRRAQ